MKQRIVQRKTSRPNARTRASSAGANGQAIAPVNRTGLPDRLKTGIEALSGFSLDDVRVHLNSSKPAELNAFAYAQGSDIHLAPGQERYLPHEAWHIVQQRQGRVKPTISGGAMPINDSPALEHEADQMGAKAIRTAHQAQNAPLQSSHQTSSFTANPETNAPAQLGKRIYYKDKHYKFKLKKKDIVLNLHIDDLIDGLDEDRVQLDKFEGLQNKGVTTFRKQPVTKYIKKIKRDITEKIGELNATQYMLTNYPNAEMLMGFSKGTGIDQVYKDGKRMIVVEAKGPGAKLGVSDRKGKQMSMPWILETSKGMRDKILGKKIRKKHSKKRLIRLVIHSTPSGNAPKNVDEF